MANISVFLQKILDAVYGEEVRGSIHDALAAMNTESSSAMEFAKTAKDSAQAGADAAQASASTATQKANAAASSAASAKSSETSANAAKAAAQTAKMDAETAKTAAEAAKNAAVGAQNAAGNSAAAAASSALSAQQYSGKPPKPQNGTWWIWDAEAGEYIDSGTGCELSGPAGVGVADFRLTQGDHAPGTVDMYALILTDGTAYPISVYNGRNGTGAGNMVGEAFDLVIPAEGWSGGRNTVADGRLFALANHQYFVAAGEASAVEYRTRGVQPEDVTATGFLTFRSASAPETDLTVRVVHMELAANGGAGEQEAVK